MRAATKKCECGAAVTTMTRKAFQKRYGTSGSRLPDHIRIAPEGTGNWNCAADLKARRNASAMFDYITTFNEKMFDARGLYSISLMGRSVIICSTVPKNLPKAIGAVAESLATFAKDGLAVKVSVSERDVQVVF